MVGQFPRSPFIYYEYQLEMPGPNNCLEYVDLFLARTVPLNHHVINLEWIKGNMFHQNSNWEQFPEIYA